MACGIANWDLALARYFVASPSGNDSNPGFVDAAPGASPLVVTGRTVRTLGRLRSVIPSYGDSRLAVIIIEAGDYTTENLNLSDFVGYRQGILARGTITNPTAASVAFGNNAADKIMAGGVIAAGTETAGYRVSAAPSTFELDCVKVAGGPAAFPAEPATLLMRLRFDAATPTALLRNWATTAWKCPVPGFPDRVVLTENPPAAPAAGGPGVGDVLYLEQPGVRVRQIQYDGVWTRLVSGFAPVMLGQPRIVGVRAELAGNAIVLRGGDQVLSSFVHAPSPSATANYSAANMVDAAASPNYNDEVGVVTRTGNGIRIVGDGTVLGGISIAAARVALQNSGVITGGVILAPDGAPGFFFTGVIHGGRLLVTGGSTAFGPVGLATVRRLRFAANAAGGLVDLSQPGLYRLFGVEEDGSIGAHSIIRLLGSGHVVELDDIVAAATGTGFGLIVQDCQNAGIEVGATTPVAITAAAGQEIVMGSGGSGAVFNFSDIQTLNQTLRDDLGNVISGMRTVTRVAPEVGQLLTSSTVPQYRVARRSGAGLVAAHAASAPNADNVIGVNYAVLGGGGRARVASNGPCIVEAEAVPVGPAVMFLSPSTGAAAGKVVTPAPAVSGQQVLPIGQFLFSTGVGTLIVIDVDPDTFPTTVP